MTISQETHSLSPAVANTSFCRSLDSDALSDASLVANREAETVATMVVADEKQSRQRRCGMEDLKCRKLQAIREDDALSDVTTAGGSFEASEADEDSDNMIFAFEEDTTNKGNSTEQFGVADSDAAGILDKRRELTLTDIIFIEA